MGIGTPMYQSAAPVSISSLQVLFAIFIPRPELLVQRSRGTSPAFPARADDILPAFRRTTANNAIARPTLMIAHV